MALIGAANGMEWPLVAAGALYLQGLVVWAAVPPDASRPRGSPRR